MRTVEELKALPGYVKLKDFLVSAKINTTVYVDTDFFVDDDIPLLMLITANVTLAFEKLYEAIPELLTVGSESFQELSLYFILLAKTMKVLSLQRSYNFKLGETKKGDLNYENN